MHTTRDLPYKICTGPPGSTNPMLCQTTRFNVSHDNSVPLADLVKWPIQSLRLACGRSLEFCMQMKGQQHKHQHVSQQRYHNARSC